MKKLALIVMMGLMCVLFTVPALAEQDDRALSDIQDALPDDAGEILSGISPSDPDAGQKGLGAVEDTIKQSGGIVRRALRSAGGMLVIVVLGSVVASALEDGGVKDAVVLATVTALAAIAVDGAGTFIDLGVSTLNELSDFSKALLPTMCTAAASAGAFTSAAAKYAATALFMDVLLTVSQKLILPLVMLYLTAVISGAALGKDTLTNISKLLKWMCTTSLALLAGAFTLYLSLTGIISGTTDAAAAKLAKSAISTLLPVVGSTVSSAAETVTAGAAMLRNSIGVFGLIGVAAVCITPFLTLGAHYLVYKAAAAVTLAISDKRISDMIDGVSDAFGMVLALVGAGALMLFLSIVSSMKAVTG